MRSPAVARGRRTRGETARSGRATFVIFYSGYDDLHYKPVPEGGPLGQGRRSRLAGADSRSGEVSGGEGGHHLAIDGPSMGPAASWTATIRWRR
jgi:hypothetical protein